MTALPQPGTTGGRKPGRSYVRHLDVDLTGSNLCPAWISTKQVVDQPPHWTDDDLIRKCADHFGVPVGQVVLKPWRKR